MLDMATSAGLNEFCTLAHVQKARCLAAKGDFAAALEVGGNLTDFVCNTRVSTVLYMGILYIAGEYFQKPEYVLVTHAHTHTHTHTHTYMKPHRVSCETPFRVCASANLNCPVSVVTRFSQVFSAHASHSDARVAAWIQHEMGRCALQLYKASKVRQKFLFDLTGFTQPDLTPLFHLTWLCFASRDQCNACYILVPSQDRNSCSQRNHVMMYLARFPITLRSRLTSEPMLPLFCACSSLVLTECSSFLSMQNPQVSDLDMVTSFAVHCHRLG